MDNLGMNTYKRHRIPPEIISYAVWLYYRLNLSHRDIEDLLAERGVTISYETIRLWCIKFGAKYAGRLKRRHQGYGDTFYIDEFFVTINGKQHYLWRAVDQDGEVVDVYLQAREDGAAAKCFFQRLLRNHGGEPRKIVTYKLRSYRVARREATKVRERGMRRFKSIRQAQDSLPPMLPYTICLIWGGILYPRSLSEPQGKCVLKME